MTRSADVSLGLIAAAQTLLETRLAVAPRPSRIRLRSSMVHLPDQDLHQQIRLPLKRKAALGVVHGLNLRHPNFGSLGIALGNQERGWIPSRTARKRGNAFDHWSRGALPMMRIEFEPPNRNHCTTVTEVLSLPLVASMRVSTPGWPSMRIGSDIVMRASRTPGMVVAACCANR